MEGMTPLVVRACSRLLRAACAAVVGCGLVATPVSAQIGGLPISPILAPPPPPPPPPPKIEIPKIPKLGDTMPLPTTSRPRSSYSDRVARCAGEAAAQGLGPAGRASYASTCAHRE